MVSTGTVAVKAVLTVVRHLGAEDVVTVVRVTVEDELPRNIGTVEAVAHFQHSDDP